jgi:Tol biopolymer transport system component
VSSEEVPDNGWPEERPVVTATGQVVFESSGSNLAPGDTNDTADVFLRDLAAGTTRRVGPGQHGVQPNGPTYGPALSPYGRYVAFISGGSNLVPGDTNGHQGRCTA